MGPKIITPLATLLVALVVLGVAFYAIMNRLAHIHILVNSRLTEVLGELSEAKNLIAELTKKPSDVVLAAKAQSDVDYSRGKTK